MSNIVGWYIYKNIGIGVHNPRGLIEEGLIENITAEILREFSHDKNFLGWKGNELKLILKEGDFYTNCIPGEICINHLFNSNVMPVTIVRFVKENGKWIKKSLTSVDQIYIFCFPGKDQLVTKFEKTLSRALRPVSVNAILELEEEYKI